jgi:guanylate kinase
MPRGPLIILSGPSGSGKSSAVQRLLTECPLKLWVSVSATTRQPREGELEGVHYHFWTRERFEQELARGGFLEWAEVHGNLYGTPRSEVEAHRDRGEAAVLVIDVQGAAQVRACCPGAVSIFMKTSSLDVLERRLRGRKTETEAAIQNRLGNARKELEREKEYDYRVLNDDLDSAVAELCGLIEAEFRRGQNHA